MDPVDLAYAAGFFDGEGSVNWQKSARASGKEYKLIRVNIGQVDRAYLDWCQLHFGGTITVRNANRHRSVQVNYQWTLSGQHACRYLEQIYPYLRLKKEKAMEYMLEWGWTPNCTATFPAGV